MKITIAPSQDQAGRTVDTTYCAIDVEHPMDDLNIDEAVVLLKRALLAWGFAEETVNSLFGNGETAKPMFMDDK